MRTVTWLVVVFGIVLRSVAVFASSPARPPHAKTVSVFGFGDFCYDGECYKNPAAAMAVQLGGSVVRADWESVDNLRITGPSVGIGLDYSAKRAYVNGTALRYQSLAVSGPDAGDYLCGYLFARLLQVSPCSVFVHLPLDPSEQDAEVVKGAIEAVYRCHAGQSHRAMGRARAR